MPGSWENKSIQHTYKDLIKLDSATDNTGITGSLVNISDGYGVASALSLSTGAISVAGTITATGNITSDSGIIGDKILLDKRIQFEENDTTFGVAVEFEGINIVSNDMNTPFRTNSGITNQIGDLSQNNSTYAGLLSGGGFNRLLISTPDIPVTNDDDGGQQINPVLNNIELHTPQNFNHSSLKETVTNPLSGETASITLNTARVILGSEDYFSHHLLNDDGSASFGTSLSIHSGTGDGQPIQQFVWWMSSGGTETEYTGNGMLLGSQLGDFYPKYNDPSTYLARFGNNTDMGIVELGKIQNNGNVYYNSDGNLLLSSSGLNSTFKGTLQCSATGTIKAGNDEDATLALLADNADDNGDSWNVIAKAATRKLEFGNNLNGSFMPHLTITPNTNAIDSTTTVAGNLVVGKNLTVTGDIQNESSVVGITIDNGGNIGIPQDLSIDGGEVSIKAANDETAKLNMSADNADDNGDTWQFVANANSSFGFANNISGALVNHLTISPHATVALSTVTAAGHITSGGNVNGASPTEMGYLSGVTSAVQTQLNSMLTQAGAATTYQAKVFGVSNTEIGYLDGVTSAIQTQLNDKADAGGYTANRALVSTGGGSIGVSLVTETEIGYLEGVTSAIQTQINSKQATLTFGITNGSPLQVHEPEGGNPVSGNFARFTSSGIEGVDIISIVGKDEDNMSSNSATHFPTQQSVKAYVDANAGGGGGGGITTGKAIAMAMIFG